MEGNILGVKLMILDLKKTKIKKICRAAANLPFAGEKAKGIFINEDLTKPRSRAYSAARNLKKSNVIQDCWTRDGLIYI